jgi:hypothetical protein
MRNSGLTRHYIPQLLLPIVKQTKEQFGSVEQVVSCWMDWKKEIKGGAMFGYVGHSKPILCTEQLLAINLSSICRIKI